MDQSGPACQERLSQRRFGAEVGAGSDHRAAPPGLGDEGRHRAERALDLMRRDAEEAVSITEIAEQVGVGLRCLQIAFAERYGLAPREMLTRLRLEKARSRLLAAPAGARVTRIALEAGFTHLSRFSQTYRQIYGERPIETLRRAQGGGGAQPDLHAAE